MKANLKGMSGIKGLLLRHGEKIGMFVVGLCAAFFVYKSLQLKNLPDDLQADKLRQKMSQSQTAVKDSKWPEPDSEQAGVVRRYTEIAATGIGEVKPEVFKTRQLGWDPAVITPTVPRTDPVLLSALDVRAHGGCGLFGFIDVEVQKARALALAAKAEKEAQDAEKQRLKDAANAGGPGGPGGEGRGVGRRGPEEGPGEFGMVEDKDHPGRRIVESGIRPQGVPLQGDERIDKKYWAVVVAKVPIKEQIKLYRDSFENAKGGFDPATDFPRYFGYLVERAEITRGQDLNWEKVEVYDGQGNRIGPAVTPKYLDALYQKIATDWVPPQPEVVDDRYLDFEGVLTYPLPPLAWRDWGSDVTHPDIPLAVNAPPREDETMPVEEQAPPPGTKEDSGGIFAHNTDPNTGMAGPGGVGMPGRNPGFGGSAMGRGPGSGFGPGMGAYGRGGESEMGMGMGRVMRPMGRGPEGGEGMGMGMGRGGGSFTRPGSNAGRTTLPRGVDSWLLRFFDFTVEPGKKYKYRVRLIVHDPNRKPGLDDNILDSKALVRIREAIKNKSIGFRMTDWSEPSPTVGIPLDGSVRMAEAKPVNPEKPSDEPTVKLLVESFGVDDKGNSIQAATEAEFRRGAVANMANKAEHLVDGGRAIDPIKSYRYHTGITLVDVVGGEKVGKDLQVPARVLLMDPTGQLYVRNELDDHFAVELHRAIFTEDKKKKGREGEMGGPEMMRGGEGRGGEGRGPRGGRGGR